VPGTSFTGPVRHPTSRPNLVPWPHRIAVYALAPFALLVLAVAGIWSSEQDGVIGVGLVLWLILALMIRLPPEVKGPWAIVCKRPSTRWLAWLAPWWVIGLLGAIALVVALRALGHEGPWLLDSWAAFAFLLSLLCYLLAMTLFELSAFRHRWPWVLYVVALIAIPWPFLWLFLIRPWLFPHGNLIWALVIAFVPPIAMRLLSRFGMEHRQAAPWTQWFRLGQVGLLLISGVLLGVAVLRLPLEHRVVDATELGRFPPANLATPPDLGAAIAAYSPVLRLDVHEQWLEASVKGFNAAATERGTPTACGPDRAGVKHDACPVVTFPGNEPPDSLTVAPGQLPQGGVLPRDPADPPIAYPYVVDVAKPEDLGKLPPTTSKVIEYWLFYPYDRWTANTALGQIVQQHPADWEFVAVGVDAKLNPTFVGYSEHCHGIWRPWKDVPVVAIRDNAVTVGLGDDATHPLSVVAAGSHANYPTTGAREPDWAGCIHGAWSATKQALGVISFGANAREQTSDTGPIQIPEVLGLAASRAVIGEAKWWGGSETTRLDGMLAGPASGTGAAAPLMQGTGAHPVRAIAAWSQDPRLPTHAGGE
jgi:hypothetical protein